MRKNYGIIILSLITCLVTAQKKAAEKTFPVKIDGTIRNYSGKRIYLHHKWNEKDFTDSAAINNGKFTFNLKSVDPNMYWFTTIRDINTQPNFIFFVDAAPMKVTLIGDSI